MRSRSRAWLGVFAAGAVCLALGMFLLWKPGREPLAQAPAESASKSPPTSTDLESGVDSSGGARSPRSAAQGEAEDDGSKAAAQAPANRRLEGTLRFFDPFGAHRPAAQGSFRLHSYSMDEPLTITVEQGVWRVDLPDDDFDLGDFAAEGKPAFLHSSNAGSFRFPADGVLELLVRRDHGCRLVVLDAANGLELRDIEVVQDHGQGQWGKQSPAQSADEQRIAEHAPSPIELEFDGDRARYFVRSPGYAWRFVHLQRSACGDYLVALQPGGDLSVTLAGAPVPDGAELRLRRIREGTAPDDSGYVEHRRALAPIDRRLDFESIEAGAYEVSVEVGANTWMTARVAAANCLVERGKRAQVDLLLPTPEFAKFVEAAGILRTNDWPKVRSLSLHSRFAPRVGGLHRYLAKLEEPPDAAGTSELAWSIPQLEPGSYSGFVGGPSFYFDLEIEPTSKRDYVIALPPMADVRLRILDARTGAPVDLERVGWLGYAGEWRPDGQINDAEFDAGLGRWRFFAPATTVSLWLNDDRYEFRNIPLELAPGVNELEVRAQRACGVTAIFVHGGEPVARAADWTIELVDADGKVAGFANPLDDAETELILKAPAPGQYRISASGLDGYRVVSALDVTVPIDAFARVVIELERVR